MRERIYLIEIFIIKKIDIDNKFPEYIRKNQNKFENWIIK